MNKLSVIICVYNTDEYMFENCLKSVFNTTIKNKEVVIIDDGSSKDYSSIVRNFNVKYLKTENQGTLKARLFGIKQSTGDYVCFVDSDDFLSFNYFQAGLTAIKDADILFNDWAFNTQSSKYVCSNDSTINTSFIEREPLKKFFEKEGREHSYYVLWNKIFKRKVLISACEEIEKLNFDKLVYAEDILINYFCFKHAKKIVNTHLGYYFYTIHENQEVVVSSKDKLLKHINASSLVFSAIENDLKSINLLKELETKLSSWKQMLCSTLYLSAKKFNDKSIINELEQKYKGYKLGKGLKIIEKVYKIHKLLPINIDEIDSILQKIYYTNKYCKVYAPKGGYAYNSLLNMKQIFNTKFKFVSKKEAEFILPKEIITFKQKFLHNTFIYSIATVLFPKGSKIRALLKRKL